MLQGFWCSDVSAAAAAVLRDCPKDARRCISIADDVLENRFVFRDHWEMERTYEPVQFGPDESDIDWAHIPCKHDRDRSAETPAQQPKRQ